MCDTVDDGVASVQDILECHFRGLIQRFEDVEEEMVGNNVGCCFMLSL